VIRLQWMTDDLGIALNAENYAVVKLELILFPFLSFGCLHL
jgi:hypothetical protein